MNNSANFDLENRTFLFAKAVRSYCKDVTPNIANIQDIKQIIRSSGSVAANYIEANESLSKPDFVYRIKICRKEAKETKLWLNLIDIHDKPYLDETQFKLLDEAHQLTLIFNAIIKKSN